MEKEIPFRFLFVFLGCLLFNRDAISAEQNKYTKLEDLEVLMLGDPCSYNAEQVRLNLTVAEIHAIVTDQNQTLARSRKNSALLLQGELLCNEKKLLLCNKTTGTCGCGEAEMFIVYGEVEGRSKYVEEIGAGCRRAVGTPCVPPEMHEFQKESGCESPSSCVSKVTGSPCSRIEIATHLLIHGKIQDKGNFYKDFITGGVCNCQLPLEDSATNVEKIREFIFRKS